MRKALVVGIDKYPKMPLSGCVNDAYAFKSVIESNGDGSPNFDTILLTDPADKAVLKGAISELFNGQCETALFYFSGHGMFNNSGGYLITPDYKQNDEGIAMDDILKMANNSEVTNKVIILDCCHSGAMGSPAVLNSSASHLYSGVTILTASRDTEVAMEVNGHGVFTSLLLSALEGGAADVQGNVTAGSVYAYIDQALGYWGQRPVFKTNVTKFNPLRTIEPQLPKQELRKIIHFFHSPTSEFPLDPTYEYTTDVAIPKHVAIFKILQRFEGVGLVVPVDEEHMYWAAMHSKSCKLTALGLHYWRLVKNKRI